MSELILRGKARQVAMKQVNGVWVFDLPSHTPTVSARMVDQLLDDSS